MASDARASTRADRRRTEDPVDLTSMIDVVFLLLIFFMVSTTFDRHSELKVELPRAGGEIAEQQSSTIDITIDRQGRYYVDRREVVNTRADTLRRAISKALGERGAELPVVISADARTPHQSVITAMDAAGRAGLYNIQFATARDADVE